MGMMVCFPKPNCQCALGKDRFEEIETRENAHDHCLILSPLNIGHFYPLIEPTHVHNQRKFILPHLIKIVSNIKHC